MSGSFPSGAQVGRFTIGERLRGERLRGQYRAMSADSAEGDAIATIIERSGPAPEELQAKLAWAVDGVAPLLHVGPLAGGDGGAAGCMIEAIPAGVPSTAPMWPLAQDHARDLLLGVAEVCQRMLAAGFDRPTLQPELIYAEFDGAGAQLTGLVPRAGAFAAATGAAAAGEERLFAATYSAPEVLRGAPMNDAALAFSLACLAAHWLCDEHPFEGDDASAQAAAILDGRRRPWDGPRSWQQVVRSSLLPDPDDRLTLEELVDWVRRGREATGGGASF